MLVIGSLAACGDSDNEPSAPGRPETPEPDTPHPGGNDRYLVLYCSRTGNTQGVARRIRAALDCDILEVAPATPYDDDYDAMLDRAQEELAAIRQGDYPAVRTRVTDFNQYDVVFVGYPIWYGSMAAPMQAFLHEHAPKLSGRRIALFATSGSSGIAASIDEARSLCVDATVMDPALLLTSRTLQQAEHRIAAWLEALGIGTAESDTPDASSPNVRLRVGGRTVTATMEDNAAAQDFLSRLPMEVTLNDYNGTTEKIFYPSPSLTTERVARGCTPLPSDMTIYAPWGNVAIFCKSSPYDDDLIPIGRIDGDGIDALSVAGDVHVRFERIR